MPDVQLSSVTKRFGELTAVDGIDLHILEGQMWTLLGPSGCGKTTTLRMIAGLEDPDAGSIRIGEAAVFDRSRRIDVPSERRDLGMVFQSYAIWPHMTVAQNVAYSLRMRRVGRDEIKRRVAAVLALVGLAGYEETPATNLSGGQQQRVALARSLVFEPRVLLLDEPLSNLDAKLREHMRFELRIMQRRLGVTAIYVTHDQGEALTLSDKVVVMNRGRIEQIGTPEEVYEHPLTRFVAEFIGQANFLDVEAVGPVVGGAAVTAKLRTFSGELPITLPAAAIRVGQPNGAPAKLSLFIRPEKIRLAAPATGSGSADGATQYLPGRIVGRAYLGDHLDYLVATAEGTELSVPAPIGENWAEGSEVSLVVAKKDMALYA
jgi:iron(III) transport system ATP-binding protein